MGQGYYKFRSCCLIEGGAGPEVAPALWRHCSASWSSKQQGLFTHMSGNLNVCFVAGGLDMEQVYLIAEKLCKRYAESLLPHCTVEAPTAVCYLRSYWVNCHVRGFFQRPHPNLATNSKKYVLLSQNMYWVSDPY